MAKLLDVTEVQLFLLIITYNDIPNKPRDHVDYRMYS